MREKIDELKKILKGEVKGSIGSVLIISLIIIVTFFILGWMLFGWVLFPVEYIPPEPEPVLSGLNGTTYETKATYVYLLQEWFAYSQNDGKLYTFTSQLGDTSEIACNMAFQSRDFAERARLVTLAGRINGIGCTYETDTGNQN